MSWIDWCILILPVLFVLGMALYTRRYIRSVADFLVAGRIAGRYVLNVGDIANGLSIIGLVGFIEVQYRTGFALNFWNRLLLPIGIVMGLTGYVTYRYRETKAMSFGQFLEMRYNSRSLRTFAAFLRSAAEVLTNMIMPAVAARFFIFFLDLPREFALFGFQIHTFSFLTIIFMAMAIFIICMGGTLALIITDAMQGMLLYPLMAIFAVFVLIKFSWSQEIVPVMMDRVPGESFLNPYDISQLRDFNLFMLLLGIVTSILHRGSWLGHATSSAARTPHEQKMSGLLGTWRYAMNDVFYVLIAAMVITMLCHRHFKNDAQEIRINLCQRATAEVVHQHPELAEKINTTVKSIPPQEHVIGRDKPLGEKSNLDTVYLDKVHKTMLDYAAQDDNKLDTPQANSKFQEFRTLYYQLMVSSSMKHILPTGLMGLFCLLLVLAMISTDDTRIYSATLTIAQDCIIPFCKRGLTPKQHVWIVRGVAILIGGVFCIGAFLMSQLDYVKLYSTLICIMWNGGCAPVVIFGLYSRFGTKAAAWSSILSGMFLGILSVFVQRRWAESFYPFLEKHDLLESTDTIMQIVAKPFGSLVHWEMNPVKCPINAYELYFLTMVITLTIYLLVSLLTYKEPFNLDRMLHRGIYNTDGENKTREKWSVKSVFRKLLGITPEYTKGDRFIAWFFFIYSFIYTFLFAFVGVVAWNAFSPWPIEWWGHYFLIVTLVVPGLMAFISSFWFGIGGIIDIRRLFHDLKERTVNHLDNGMVENGVALSDEAGMDEAMKRQNGTKADSSTVYDINQ